MAVQAQHRSRCFGDFFVFELEPAGEGTLLRMTESGFRERGWSEGKTAEEYAAHITGWDFFLPRLPVYAAKVGAGA